jgi:large subunit ribosomal protein L2
MGMKTYNPTTPSQRFRQSLDNGELAKKRPEKSLSGGKASQAGRGAGGRISVRRRGGGHKRKFREIDFKRNKTGVPGKVAFIEYDPNRSANIALIHYNDGKSATFSAPKGFRSARPSSVVRRHRLKSETVCPWMPFLSAGRFTPLS